MYDRQALIDRIRLKALRFGQFTLASGKQASFYLDLKQVTLDSLGARLVGEGLLELLNGRWPAAVGGMSIGADPIVAAVLTLAGQRNRELAGFLVRKEPKGHGTNRYLEGPVAPGAEAVILEDVVTTGGSSQLAIDRATEFGLRVTGVLCIVDRLAGGREAFEARGLRFASLLTIRDFGIEQGPT